MIKVLVADDNPRRHQKLRHALGEIAGITVQLDVVTSANEARQSLAGQQYDLMVMDIILPLRAEDDPSEQHSLELLTELTEFDSQHKPNLIVGLTADPELAQRVAPRFEAHLWTVVRYSDDNDTWVAQIVNCVRYIHDLNVRPQRTGYQTDLVVLCALPEPEFRAVMDLPWNWSAPRPLDDVTFIREGSFQAGGQTRSVMAACAPRMGMVASALLAARLIMISRPRMLAMTGICAGIRGKANLGDVVLADPSWDWQSGKRARGDEGSLFAVAPHMLDVDATVRARFEQMRADRPLFSGIADAWPNPAPAQLKLVIGPVASGSAVIADSTLVPEIQSQHREACGVEMEAYGVYAAAAATPGPKPLVFSVKSVCDFADELKDDTHQAYAAYTSAQTLKHFVETYFSSLDA